MRRPIGKTKNNLLVSFIQEKFPDGLVTATGLLELARPKRSPIHDFFEWDNTRAAELYRLEQARLYIRTIVVEIKGEPVRQYVPPVFIDEIHEKKAYVRLDVAQNNESIWSQVVETAMREATSWAKRYKRFSELSLITKAIAETERKLSREKAVKAGSKSKHRTQAEHTSNPIQIRQNYPSRRDTAARATILRKSKTRNGRETAKAS